MIPDFENITFELTEKEKQLVPVLIAGFKKHVGKEQAITGATIVEKLRAKNISMTEPRLRKLCNYIRCNSLLPLIATSAGYFLGDETEVQMEIKSLWARAQAIWNAAEGLGKYNFNQKL